MTLVNSFTKNKSGIEILFFSKKLEEHFQKKKILSNTELKNLAILLQVCSSFGDDTEIKSLAVKMVMKIQTQTNVDVKNQISKLPKELIETNKEQNASKGIDAKKEYKRIKEISKLLDTDKNKLPLYEKLAESLKNKQDSDFLSLGREIFNTYELVQKTLLSRVNDPEFKVFVEINFATAGKLEFEKAIKKNEDLSVFAKSYFYSKAGLQAQLMLCQKLLKNNKPFFAAAHIHNALQTIENLKNAVSYKDKEELSLLKNKFELLGALAFKSIGDDTNYQKLRENIESQTPPFLDKNKILKTLDCLKPQEDFVLKNYYSNIEQKIIKPELLSAIVQNAPYIYNYLQSKKIPYPYINKEIFKRILSETADFSNMALVLGNRILEKGPLYTTFASSGWHGLSSLSEYQLKDLFNEDSILEFIAALNHPSPAINRLTKQGLLSIKEEKSLPALLSYLENNKSNKIDREILNILSLMKKKHPSLVKAAIKYLNDRDVELRNSAAIILEKYCNDYPIILPLLAKTLRTHPYDVQVLHSIAKCGNMGMGVLLTELENADEKLEMDIISMAIIQNIDAKKAVPILIQALKGSHTNMIENVAYTLKFYGKDAASAIPDLIRLLKKHSLEKNSISHVTSDALIGIGEASLPALIELLDDKETNIRSTAAYSIYEIARKPNANIASLKKIIPKLQDMEKTNTGWAKTNATKALSVIQK
jgi:HEAT repeat protein